jgi:PilZ domain
VTVSTATVSQEAQLVSTILGEYVTIALDGTDHGDVYVGRRQDDRTYVLHPMLPSQHPPRAGQTVKCVSVAGHWTTTVRSAKDGVLEVQVPSWVTRPAPRRAVRVPMEHALWLHVGDRQVAGRLRDLSQGGAAVLLERHVHLAPGIALRATLPPGDLPATVRSIRAHEHPLLDVAGLSWGTLDAACRSWVAAQVGAAVAKRFRSRV